MNNRLRRSVVVAALLVAACASNAYRQTPDPGKKEIAFGDFIADARTARFEDYASRPGARVEGPAAFEEMRSELLFLYQGVTPRNTSIG